MPGSTPPTSQLDWLSSTTAMIVLLWSRATRDLLRSFGWGIAVLHRLDAATKLPPPRRPPHRIFQYASTERWHRATDLLLPPTVKRRSAGRPPPMARPRSEAQRGSVRAAAMRSTQLARWRS